MNQINAYTAPALDVVELVIENAILFFASGEDSFVLDAE